MVTVAVRLERTAPFGGDDRGTPFIGGDPHEGGDQSDPQGLRLARRIAQGAAVGSSDTREGDAVGPDESRNFSEIRHRGRATQASGERARGSDATVSRAAVGRAPRSPHCPLGVAPSLFWRVKDKIRGSFESFFAGSGNFSNGGSVGSSPATVLRGSLEGRDHPPRDGAAEVGGDELEARGVDLEADGGGVCLVGGGIFEAEAIHLLDVGGSVSETAVDDMVAVDNVDELEAGFGVHEAVAEDVLEMGGVALALRGGVCEGVGGSIGKWWSHQVKPAGAGYKGARHPTLTYSDDSSLLSSQPCALKQWVQFLCLGLPAASGREASPVVSVWAFSRTEVAVGPPFGLFLSSFAWAGPTVLCGFFFIDGSEAQLVT